MTQSTTRHPDIAVTLTSDDWIVEGNAFEVLGAVQAALRSAGVPDAEVSEFHAEAITGDYDPLLQTVMRWYTSRDQSAPERPTDATAAANRSGCPT